MRLLFLGPLWEGSTALQRLEGFRNVEGLHVSEIDSLERVGRASLAERIRHRFRWPVDRGRVNERLLHAVEEVGPDLVFIDSTRVVTRRTVRLVREHGALVAFYSPDDVSARHNSSRQLESCDREWDAFFTTKSFNIPELRARGVRRPMLVGKAYDPSLHRPITPEEVGAEFERFDAVFVGTCEGERQCSLNALADAGISVVIYGNGWSRSRLHPEIVLRAAVFSHEYTRALHTGKVALGFLRKLNRDRVTQRSVELPAAARPMVAEKTAEHDEMFLDGVEYVSFSTDEELLERVGALLSDEPRRQSVAAAGRRRCIASGYSTLDRARQMVRAISEIQ